MNTIEAVEEIRLNSEEMMRNTRKASREFIGVLEELFTPKDNTNDLFNDHSIIGFENRCVNDGD